MRDNWKEYKLDELGKHYGGLTNKSKDNFGKGLPYIPYLNIFENGKINPSNLDFVEIFPSESQNKVKYGDLFFTTSSETAHEVGMTSVLLNDLGEAYLNSFCFGFRLNNFDILLPEYAAYLFRGKEIRKLISDLAQGSTRYNLSKSIFFDKLKFYLPPLPQQRKIASILSTCDEVIEQTEAAIAKYQALKQGMMHDLFTRGIDVNTGKLRPSYQDAPELYKESELGMIPKDWEVKKLEDITNYVDYRGKTPPKTDKGIFLMTAKNIKFGFIDYEISKEYIPPSAYKAAMLRGIPEIGDVLITTEAPMGNVAQINIVGLALAQRVIKYRCYPNEMLNDFLKHSMMSEYFQNELEAESTGSTVKGIKGSRLHLLNVMKPSILEQEKIVHGLAPVEAKIETEQSSLAKYQQLKAGLMQDLLTGKVEVSVAEEILKN